MPALLFGLANLMRLTVGLAASDSISAISAGSWHALALKSDGSLWAWGFNYQGRLGVGTGGLNDFRSTPTRVGASVDWKTISAGGSHTLALKTSGRLWAWGDNGYGQLGNGKDGLANSSFTPIEIGIDADWVEISAGGSHSLARKSDGSLWAWGSNSYGQLGDGTKTNSNIPVKVGTESNWKAISAGASHSLALKNDGSLWAWGANSYGQLGNDTKVNSSEPVRIGTGTWKAISAGGWYTLALKSDGSLWAWGDNETGQLGIGSNSLKDFRSTPVQVGADTNWSAISAGNAHALALKSNGSLWTWGYNSTGQLGYSGANRNTPVRVGTDANWLKISAGGYYSLALKSDGVPFAWGNNRNGQLGNGKSGLENSSSAPAIIGAGVNWVVPPVSVDSVTVHPDTANVQKGTDYRFSATVTGSYSPEQSVTWNVSGNDDPETVISANGILTVASGETAASLTVTATSTIAPDKSGTATVTVIDYVIPEPIVTSVTVTPSFIELNAGDTRMFSAEVDGPNPPSQSVTWMVEGKSIESETEISEDGLLTIDADETAPTLTVRATSTVSPGISGTATVTVLHFVAVTGITDVPEDASVEEPLFLTGTVNPSYATNQTIIWSIQDQGDTDAEIIDGNTLYATKLGTVTVTATITNGRAVGTDYTDNFVIRIVEDGHFSGITESLLTGIAGLAFEADEDGPFFVRAEELEFDITDDGEGNFSAVIYGDTDDLTIYGVGFIVENMPTDATLELRIEMNGVEIPLPDVYEKYEADIYVSEAPVTFNYGDTGVYKLYVDGLTLVGTFTVEYAELPTLRAQQTLTAGSYYFAPVVLPIGPGYYYEVIERPATLGGTAPWVNIWGKFIFAQETLPANISRAGEYVVEVTDGDGKVVAVYKIIVE